MTWNPYSLKKPCKNCPFLKEGAIELHPNRVPGIVNELLSGESTGFSCHKTVYSKKTGGQWVEDPDAEDGERYEQSGQEKQCAGALIVLEKMGKQTQLMQIMQRLGVYEPDKLKPYFDLVRDPEDILGE